MMCVLGQSVIGTDFQIHSHPLRMYPVSEFAANQGLHWEDRMGVLQHFQNVQHFKPWLNLQYHVPSKQMSVLVIMQMSVPRRNSVRYSIVHVKDFSNSM